jgi:hypothetical protein
MQPNQHTTAKLCQTFLARSNTLQLLEMAEPGVDAEVLAVMNLAGAFLWSVWAQEHADDEEGRMRLAQRFADEALRLPPYGSMCADSFFETSSGFAKALWSRQRRVAPIRPASTLYGRLPQSSIERAFSPSIILESSSSHMRRAFSRH